MSAAGSIVVRTVVVYALLVVVLRFAGKRTIGNFTAFDLLVALMIGEAVDNIIFAEVPFLHGVTMIVTVVGLHLLNTWITYRSPRLDRLLAGTPTVIVRQGHLDPAGMRSERMNEQDVLGELRHQGVDRLDDVERATVEVDGQVSVIKRDPTGRGESA